MIRHTFAILVSMVICSLLLFSRSAMRADATADARKEIEAVYARRVAAYNKRDAAGYLASFAPEYQSVNRAGRVITYAQFRQSATKAMAAPPGSHYNFVVNVQSIKLMGNQAVVIVKEHTDTHGSYPKTKAVYKRATDQVLETVWSKRASGWLELSVKVLSYRQLWEE